MATIEKRSAKQWRVKVRKRGYPDQSKSFTTKSAASCWARKIESEMDDGSFVSRRESEGVTLKMLLSRYAEEITPHKKSAHTETYRIAALKKHKMSSLPISNLHSHVIASYRDERLKKVASGTVLKELSLLGHAIPCFGGTRI